MRLTSSRRHLPAQTPAVFETYATPTWFVEERRYAWREWKDAERSPVIVPYAALKLRNMYRAVRRRKQRQYMHQRMADIDKLASKDMAHSYRVFGWRRHSLAPGRCTVSMPTGKASWVAARSHEGDV